MPGNPSARQALLEQLARRCETEEPSEGLDEEIGRAVGNQPIRMFNGGLDADEYWIAFTRSLDAAVTLVPEGRGYVIRSYGDGAASCIISDAPRDVVFGKARTGSNPALSVCAASLRARAQEVGA